MIKMITLLKKRPGMSANEFQTYYESCHARLGERYVSNAVKYVRRFVKPMPELYIGKANDPDFDVIMELWFENRTELNKALEVLFRPEVASEIENDEIRLFDREHTRVFVVTEECESQLR